MAEIRPGIERMVAILDERKTALDAARVMAEKFIGSVVVTGSSTVTGLYTERDLMRAVAQGRNPAETKLRDAMRRDLPRVAPGDSVERCLELMRHNRSRHLLVYEGEEFVGIVSLRDLVALMLAEKEELIRQLTRYITG
jgi:CBS domain-containing protein